MQFKSLRIERKLYGPFEGQIVGEAEFDGMYGTINVALTPELAARVLVVCAGALSSISREAAALMTKDIIEALPNLTTSAVLGHD